MDCRVRGSIPLAGVLKISCHGGLDLFERGLFYFKCFLQTPFFLSQTSSPFEAILARIVLIWSSIFDLIIHHCFWFDYPSLFFNLIITRVSHVIFKRIYFPNEHVIFWFQWFFNFYFFLFFFSNSILFLSEFILFLTSKSFLCRKASIVFLQK